MSRRQFIQLLFMTALETYFFNDSIVNGHYILALFWAYFLMRNLRMAYVMGKVIQTIDKEVNKRK